MPGTGLRTRPRPGVAPEPQVLNPGLIPWIPARLELKDQPLRWPQHRAGRAVLAHGGRPLFLSRWFSGLLEGLQDMVVNFLQSKRFRREKVEATK